MLKGNLASRLSFDESRQTLVPEGVHSTVLIESSLASDRFGNRMGYFQEKDAAAKTDLLISREGEEFLKAHESALESLVAGLHDPALEETDTATNKYLDLGAGIKIAGFMRGGQSMLYMVKIDEEYYILKTKLNRADGLDVSQSYINEMLQTQSVEVDLKVELERFEVVMPRVLFATQQMMFRKFEVGTRSGTLGSWNIKKRNEFTDIVSQYVKAQGEQNSSLWQNVQADVIGSNFPGTYAFKNDAFIAREDGEMVWVDPFVYRKELD